jgi:molecular chaperone DnaK
LGEQVDEASKTEIEAGIKDVRESLTSEDAGDIRSKSQALQAAFHKVSEAMYERAQQQAQAEQASSTDSASGNGAAAEDEDVVDAEGVDEGKS